MKRLTIAMALALSLCFWSGIPVSAGGALASSGATQFYGPFSMTSPDAESCGNVWAEDTFTGIYKVRSMSGGGWDVTFELKQGTFVTNGGPSPGACDTKGPHGSTVAPGILGNFHGFYEAMIPGGTFDPSACNDNPDCSSPFAFIFISFSQGGSWGCFSGPSCQQNFEYQSSDPTLDYHHFQFFMNGGLSSVVGRGDIANA